MNRKGDLVFWEISDFKTTKEKLESLGFGDFVPRNDHRATMIKALKTVTRGNEKLYRKFNDRSDLVHFGIFAENVSGDSLSIDRELIFKLDKITGAPGLLLSPGQDYAQISNTTLWKGIVTAYNAEMGSIDAGQFRSVVLRAVKKCYGIAMRRGGGIYFIDKRFDETRTKLQQLFDAFPTNTKIHSVPIYDDKGTEEAIEHAVNEDILSDIESLIEDINTKFNEGNITLRILEGRKNEAQEILNKAKVHESNLRKSVNKIKTRINNVTKALLAVTSKVEANTFDPADFYKELEKS